MTDVKKFMFDTKSFDKTTPEAATYTEEQLVLAKSQAMAQGKADGVKETRAGQEEQISSLVQKMLAQAEKLAKNEDRREVEKSIDAVKLAMRTIHKMLPALATQCSLSEIENIILQSIETRRDEPRLVITVATSHLEALKIRLDALSIDKSYAGKLILIADDAMAPTDCRVEWADGGAERLYERLFAQIDNELARAIAGLHTKLDDKN